MEPAARYRPYRPQAYSKLHACGRREYRAGHPACEQRAADFEQTREERRSQRASTNDVAVMPGPNTAMPDKTWRRYSCGTDGRRRRAPACAASAGRVSGSRMVRTNALSKTRNSTANTGRTGCARVCAIPPGQQRAEASAEHHGHRRAVPPADAVAFRQDRPPTLHAADTSPTPTAIMVSRRATASIAMDDGVAKSAQATSAAKRPGSKTALRPRR